MGFQTVLSTSTSRKRISPRLPSREPLLSLKRPVIGYVGLIGTKVDFKLLQYLSQKRPDWSFVLIGAIAKNVLKSPEFQNVKAQPNVVVLGMQPYESLPNWLKGIDVCMMCYRLDSHAFYGYPLKMHEYFAAGKPIVTSDICAVSDYGHALLIARSPQEWLEHIEEHSSI